ncbi:MAG: tRNA (N(6)-L-threonylcarbamoyladenosine(37)-C(2))-methylthiotransferase MtaB [Elusimicrobiota bacterium]
MKIYFHTFGCKVNQYETELLREEFDRKGWVFTGNFAEADVCLINSCAVTTEAEQKCRQFIRRLRRRNPQAKIILTGCYPQLQAEKLKTIFPAIEIFPQQKKNKIVDTISGYTGKNFPLPAVNNANNSETISRFAGHERAFVKIQDGCQTKCSYCVVPYARPNFWFQKLEKVLEEVKKLVENGYKEIVLTGIRLGIYPDLLPLLEQLELVPGLQRIRLSSLEITEVSEGLIDLLAGTKKLARHLHLPLQSGDRDILKAMKRWYTPEDFLRIVEKLRRKIPDIGITSDLIVGFPCEAEENFRRTVQLVKILAFSGLHIFSFSPRPGTIAAGLPGQISGEVKKERYRRLKTLDNLLRQQFIQEFIGKKVEVLVESKEINNFCSGFSPQYFRVCFPAVPGLKNKVVSVQIESTEKNLAYGRI